MQDGSVNSILEPCFSLGQLLLIKPVYAGFRYVLKHGS